MNRTRATLLVSAFMTVGVSIATGCTDVGDSSAIPDQDGNASGAPDSGEDAPGSQADTSQVGTGVDATSDAAGAPDSGVDDTGAADSTVLDTGVEDTYTPDSSVQDTGIGDTGTPNSSLQDTGVRDAGTQDSRVEDAGAEDAGILDSPVEDTGTLDSGTAESSVPESGIEDAGVAGDASKGGGLLPCTTASQTPASCVPCAGNATGVCTPTEAAFVQHDIDEGNATAAAGDGADGCYSCLLMAGCLDDTEYQDHSIECGDLSATFNAGAQAGTADSTLCLATLSCILQTSCAAGGVSVDNCYCGPTHAGSVCASAGSAVDGACLTPEVNGLGFDVSDNTDILKNFDDNTRPAGMINQTFQCAVANTCTSCLQ
jgi:hypothetical protein